MLNSNCHGGPSRGAGHPINPAVLLERQSSYEDTVVSVEGGAPLWCTLTGGVSWYIHPCLASPRVPYLLTATPFSGFVPLLVSFVLKSNVSITGVQLWLCYPYWDQQEGTLHSEIGDKVWVSDSLLLLQMKEERTSFD